MLGLGFGIASMLGTVGQTASGLMSTQSRVSQISDEIRNAQMRKAQTVGLAGAKSGASGVEFSSASTQHYLTSLGSEFDREIASLRDLRSTTQVTGAIGALAGLVGGGANTAKDLWALNG